MRGRKGVRVNEFGEPSLCDVVEVGVENLLVHDEFRADPTLAFALSRLSNAPTVPTPVGVFRDVERPVYDVEVHAQIERTRSERGPGDLTELLRSGAVWTVG